MENTKGIMMGNLFHLYEENIVVEVIKVMEAHLEVHSDALQFWTEEISEFKPIDLNEERLLNLGFEKKTLNERFGNGQDWQPLTSKTVQKDYLLDLGVVWFMVREEIFYHTPKGETDLKADNSCWYFGVISDYYKGILPNLEVWRDIDKVHLLQNLIESTLGMSLKLKHGKLEQ